MRSVELDQPKAKHLTALAAASGGASFIGQRRLGSALPEPSPRPSREGFDQSPWRLFFQRPRRPITLPWIGVITELDFRSWIWSTAW